MRARRLLSATFLAVTLTGCSTGGDVSTALVQIFDDGPDGGIFEPATLVVPPGTEVRWRNEGAWQHVVTTDSSLVAGEPAVPKGFEPWEPALLNPGGTFAQTLDVEGNYLYWTEQGDGQRSYGTIRVESP